MTEREYDNIHNEGYADGYNPIRAARWIWFDEPRQREFEQAQADARARLLTPAGRIEALQMRIHLECGYVARECGNNDAIDDLQRDLYAQIKCLQDQIDAPLRSGGQRGTHE